jgi:hypothetical protein
MAHVTLLAANVPPQIVLLDRLASRSIPTTQTTNDSIANSTSTNFTPKTHMETRIFDLLERAVIALESIAQPLCQPLPDIDESERPEHMVLANEVRIQLKRLGFDRDNHTPAKKLLASMFIGKTALSELTIIDLTRYAQLLRVLEGYGREH